MQESVSYTHLDVYKRQDVYVSVHKVGGFGIGFFTRSEGVLLKSENLLTEKDPAKAVWETLPDGEYGLRTPPGGGSISEEQSYVVLSDKSIYSVYRTVDGYPCETYSRDKAHTVSYTHLPPLSQKASAHRTMES